MQEKQISALLTHEELFEKPKSGMVRGFSPLTMPFMLYPRHLKSFFEEGELERAAVVAKIATTAADGTTYLVDSIIYLNWN